MPYASHVRKEKTSLTMGIDQADQPNYPLALDMRGIIIIV